MRITMLIFAVIFLVAALAMIMTGLWDMVFEGSIEVYGHDNRIKCSGILLVCAFALFYKVKRVI